jgi:hypothetical protein
MVCNISLLKILKQDSNNAVTDFIYLFTAEIVLREFISGIQDMKIYNNLNFNIFTTDIFLKFCWKRSIIFLFERL